ncbi:hypothetical protein Tco_1370020 [Tanacetum coccineum]
MLEIQAEEGEGLGHPSEPQPPPSTAQPTNEEPIPNVVSSSHQKTQTPRQALNKVTELPQTSEPIPNVTDEAVYEEWDDRVERATTTAASLDAEQASGGSPRCQEAMGVPLLRLGLRGLKLRVKKMEKNRKRARTPQPMKRRLFKVKVESSTDENLDEEGSGEDSAQGEAHSQEDQPEDHLGVLSEAKVLADVARKNVHAYTRRRRAVSTGSGGISTASRLFSTAKESVSTVGASMPVSTTDEQTKRIKLQQEQDRLGHEAAVRLQEELDKEERQRMARGHKVAQSFTEEEWENIRVRIKADEELTQRLQAEERNKYSKVDQAKMLLRGYSFDEIKELFETTMKRVNTFVPLETEVRGRASELAAGSSQATITDSAEVRSSKRAAEAELDHEGSKRQKTNEASGSVQEQPYEEEKELLQEDLQQMMMVVPVEEVYVEAL